MYTVVKKIYNTLIVKKVDKFHVIEVSHEHTVDSRTLCSKTPFTMSDGLIHVIKPSVLMGDKKLVFPITTVSPAFSNIRQANKFLLKNKLGRRPNVTSPVIVKKEL